jgi:hypothetical protein
MGPCIEPGAGSPQRYCCSLGMMRISLERMTI